MKTIISNSCVGSRIYEQMKEQFNHPLIWARILRDDVFSMIDNWGKINFSNFELVNPVESYPIFGIRIDKKFTVYYPHYIKDEQYDTPTKMVNTACGLDIRYNKIDEYIIDKYKERLKRMDVSDTLFVFNQSARTYFDTFEDLFLLQKKLQQNNLKSVIITNIEELSKYSTDNNRIIIAKAKLSKLSTTEIAKIILKHIDI